MAMSAKMNDARLGPYSGTGLTLMTQERLEEITRQIHVELILRKLAKALIEGSKE